MGESYTGCNIPITLTLPSRVEIIEQHCSSKLCIAA
jgi:hypothetical protein